MKTKELRTTCIKLDCDYLKICRSFDCINAIFAIDITDK